MNRDEYFKKMMELEAEFSTAQLDDDGMSFGDMMNTIISVHIGVLAKTLAMFPGEERGEMVDKMQKNMLDQSNKLCGSVGFIEQMMPGAFKQ